MTDLFCRLLFLMIAGHALADGPLQDQAMKTRKASAQLAARFQGLAQHGLIHGGIVALVTGFWWLGALEAIAHFAIDYFKGRGRISHLVDQLIHMLCKIAWASIAIGIIAAQ